MTENNSTTNNTSSDVIKVSPGITTEPEELDFNDFASPVYQPGIVTKHVITRIPLVKYPKQKFFKTHPTMAWLGVPAIIKKDENEIYLLSGEVAEQLASDDRMRTDLVHLNLFVVHLRGGELNVIYIQTEDAEGKWNAWHKSLTDLVVNHGREHWIRVVPNRTQGCYEAFTASESWVEPEWPEMTLGTIMNYAFEKGDRIIRSIDNTVLKELRGV